MCSSGSGFPVIALHEGRTPSAASSRAFQRSHKQYLVAINLLCCPDSPASLTRGLQVCTLHCWRGRHNRCPGTPVVSSPLQCGSLPATALSGPPHAQPKGHGGGGAPCCRRGAASRRGRGSRRGRRHANSVSHPVRPTDKQSCEAARGAPQNNQARYAECGRQDTCAGHEAGRRCRAGPACQVRTHLNSEH